MNTYSPQQRIKIIDFYYSSQRSIVLTQRNYRRFFNVRSAPTSSMIASLVRRFEELGSVADRPGRGAHRNIRTVDNVEAIQQCCK
ncbi:unnamed protein product [Parnassius mnemosyne]|uniref:DUF4817 domain-containing protein n=1 Tax=Parnassius mnemosyne TaxID=213953 RepID=A0AAV1LBU6_9NEOP